MSGVNQLCKENARNEASWQHNAPFLDNTVILSVMLHFDM